MKFVYNGKFFEYFEVGRTELMREVGLTYKKIEEMGYQMPVLEMGIKFRNAAFYDELLEIVTTLPAKPELKVHLEHKINSKDRGILIAEGFVDLMFIRAETKRACRPPEFFLNAVRKFYE